MFSAFAWGQLGVLVCRALAQAPGNSVPCRCVDELSAHLDTMLVRLLLQLAGLLVGTCGTDQYHSGTARSHHRYFIHLFAACATAVPARQGMHLCMRHQRQGCAMLLTGRLT
jgi:hypothetical protein